MQFSLSPITLVTVFAVIIGLIALLPAYRRRAELNLARPGIALAIFPPLAMLGLFYSLAIHMRQSLGAWPNSIGNRGFSPLLVSHADIVSRYIVALLVLSLFALPVVTLLCLLVPRWKRFVPYLVLYALLYLACWGLMLLAPKSFLNWWWD